MVHVQAYRSKPECRVRFELPAGVEVAAASVVGDFNAWDPAATPMKRQKGGGWTASVRLPQGKRFEFRYRVRRTVESDVNDAGWLNDEHCECCDNPFGGQNSVVVT